MANIRLDLDSTIINGQSLTFRSPTNCSNVSGLIVYYPEVSTTKSKTFQFADAHGNNVGRANLFAENVLVKVILDTELNRAYVQNADTNSYIESTKASVPTTVRGASASVEDSDHAPFHGLTLYGKTTQFTTTGKNLIPNIGTTRTSNGVTFTVNEDKSITVNGTASAHTYFVVSTDLEKRLPAGQYRLTGCPSGGSGSTYCLRDNYSSTVRESGEGADFTISGETTVYIAILISAGVVCNNLVFKPMVSTDLSATYNDYEPYTGGKPAPNPDYPQELESVGASGNIGVTVLGKNLFGGNALADKLVEVGRATKDETNGTVTYTGQNVANVVLFDNFKENTQYTFILKGLGTLKRWNLGIVYTDGTVGLPPNFSAENTIETICFVSDSAKSISYLKGVWADGSTTLYYDKCGIFEGVLTEADFEPYITEQTLTAQTPNGLPGIPVSSGGNYTDESGQQWICDEVDFAKGVYVKRVKTDVLDGDENWTKSNKDFGSVTYFYAPYNDMIATNKERKGAVLSDRFVESYGDNTIEHIRVNGSVGELMLFITTSRLSEASVNGLKEWLAGHNTKIMYRLDKPTETPLSAEELAQYAALHTNKPNTTVFNDSGAEMEITYCTPNTAVPMNMGSGNAGKVLSVDEHGCVVPKRNVCITFEDMDHIRESCTFYAVPNVGKISGVPDGVSQDYWYGEHVEFTLYNKAYQRLTYGSAGYQNCYVSRARIGDTWDDWEWENPPMLLGVEYRTTERWNDKPVYTKAVEFGTLPNNETKTVAWTPDSGTCEHVIGYSGTTSGYGALPNDFANISLSVNHANIIIQTNADRSSGSAVVAIKYTKL